MITNSVIEKDSYEESRDWELDSLNYDEANTESKIRKTGVINVTVDNIDSSSEGISKVVDKYGGSIVSSSQRGEGSSEYISITIKTPVEYFEDTYNDIKNIDGDITSASYYTDEVTQQYTDLESRLKNLESTEDQLVNILNDATTVEDTLAVYEQLTSIRSQIEVIKGQIKYLDNQVDYSYLTVNLSLSDTGKEVTDEQWKPLGVIKSAFSALIAFGIFIADALIWLIVFIPVVAIVLGVVLLVKRLKNKKK
jgi:chromosome segregation ATPase